MNGQLRNAAIGGLISIVLFFPALALENFIRVSHISFWFYPLFLLVSLVAALLFYHGFYLLGGRLKNKLLLNTSLILIVLMPLLTLYRILLATGTVRSIWSVEQLFLIPLGIVNLFFGIGVLQMRKKFGPLAGVAGILEIVAGLSIASVFLLGFYYFVIALPVVVIETVLLLRAARKL